jgi:hypothetical protein
MQQRRILKIWILALFALIAVLSVHAQNDQPKVAKKKLTPEVGLHRLRA